jgi:hypothetical protein
MRPSQLWATLLFVLIVSPPSKKKTPAPLKKKTGRPFQWLIAVDFKNHHVPIMNKYGLPVAYQKKLQGWGCEAPDNNGHHPSMVPGPAQKMGGGEVKRGILGLRCHWRVHAAGL